MPRRQCLDHFISQQWALKLLGRQVGSQVWTAVMEIELCTCVFVLLNVLHIYKLNIFIWNFLKNQLPFPYMDN